MSRVRVEEDFRNEPLLPANNALELTNERYDERLYNGDVEEGEFASVTTKWLNKFKDPRNAFVAFLILASITLGTVNRLMYRINLQAMQPYSYFLSLFTSLNYTFWYFVILFKRKSMGIVTDEMMSFPKREFVWIGLCDALGSFFGLLGAAHIDGPLYVLLPQGSIPFTMFFSWYVLRRTYIRGQFIGAAVVMAGLGFALVPSVQHDMNKGDGFFDNGVHWDIIYFFSTAPSALSFVLKERVFAKKPLDVFIVSAFGSAFQFLFTILFLPVVSIPGFGGVPFAELGSNVSDAATCFGGHGHTHNDDDDKDYDCYLNPSLTLLYMCVNISWNITLILIVKHGSAFLMFLAIIPSLPLANCLFYVSWPNLPASEFHPLNIVGLCVILLGLTLYRYYSVVAKKRQAETPMGK